MVLQSREMKWGKGLKVRIGKRFSDMGKCRVGYTSSKVAALQISGWKGTKYKGLA